ncbi:MAG: hypothetical protein ACYTFZ_05735, partial [Planctomycetota bacterium]
MTDLRAVGRIAARIPAELKELRGKLMLEFVCTTLGVEEVTCPACRGAGRLRAGDQERCPLCCGFQEVPDRLAHWFRAQIRLARPRPPSPRA